MTDDDRDPTPAQESSESADVGRPDAELLGRAVLLAATKAPDDMLSALRELLLTRTAALDVVLRLPDYRMTQLRPFTGTGVSLGLLRAVRVGEPVCGLAYSQQQVLTESTPGGVLVHAPATARGQRLGVLSVAFPAAPSTPDRRAALTLALAAGYLLLQSGDGTDVYETYRRHGRLSVAAEMQWQLLPARAFQTPHFSLAGHLEPALQVGGDAFDFSADVEVLAVTAVDAAGEAQSASLVSTLAVTALRNACRAGLPIAEQAALAGAAVWREHSGRSHVPALLVRLDASSGRAVAVDAGSPAVFRVRDGVSSRLALHAQLPLGMFPDTEYVEQPLELRPGDRLLMLTDGALAIHPPDDLARAVDDTWALEPAEAVRQLVAGLLERQSELADDATVVCVDWR